MSATDAQLAAISAEGNVLVAAGAGAGKTTTLVERCVRLVCDGCSLENILMVTFTEAAAGEMRARIRKALEERLASWRDELHESHPDLSGTRGTRPSSKGVGVGFPLPSTGRGIEGEGWERSEASVVQQQAFPFLSPLTPALSPLRGEGEKPRAADPAHPALRVARSALEAQLALLDMAHISTLHSFCFKLIRRHFHELQLDPQLSVLDEARTTVLMEDTLDEIFRQHYSGKTELGGAVEQLIQTHAGGREEPVRKLILKVHHFTQTQPNPRAWLDSQLAALRSREPTAWRGCLLDALRQWKSRWLEPLRSQPAENTTAHRIAAELEALTNSATLEQFAAVLANVPEKSEFKPKHRRPEGFFDDARFLRSVTVERGGIAPLAQDWEWSREGMETLLLLARRFSDVFAAAKREQAALDFHDLEQFALRLLWDAKAETATELGRKYREQFHYVFVDEYQDINAAQDAIIRAVSRDGGNAECGVRSAEWGITDTTPHSAFRIPHSGNRFLVGDVKQSIYRFRLADPRIFQTYEERWRKGDGGQVIPLSDNFRSREALLDFFNAVFADLMRPEIGRVKFDADARLQFGARERRSALSRNESPGPRVHLHLRVTSPAPRNGEDAENDSNVAELTAAENEARIVANRLRELVEQKHQVAEGDGQRNVQWADMAVLLRSPRAKAEVYAREFARQNIPLEVAQNDFFETLEVMDLLNLLMLLDNPLQDVPLLAVLHSPLVGLTANELAEVRLANRSGHFWTALNRFHEASQSSAAWPKVNRFLERFACWRRMARHASVAQRLETVLAETHYLDWLAASAPNAQRAAQCLANVRRLLTLAQQFDPFQRQGVQRFLKFVEAQRDVAGKEPIAGSGSAVQLISIHRSKGLEYPVVVVPDLGKRFNLDDLKGNILLHEQLGLCPRIKPPQIGRAYPSLAHWLYAKLERPELLGEEMRLLYVAMTRARDTLLLVGTASRKRVENVWPEVSNAPDELLAARSMLEWLGPWFARHAGGEWPSRESGSTELFSWRFYFDAEVAPAKTNGTSAIIDSQMNSALKGDTLTTLLAWKYPFDAATREAAKTSVSALRRKMLAPDEEARVWRFEVPAESRGKLSAAEIGTAHHTFLEFAELPKLAARDGALAEAQRLVDTGVLSTEEADELDHDSIVQFWSSKVGAQFLAELVSLKRELPFTARFSSAELRDLGLATTAIAENEFIVVQGVVDLAVVRQNEIWLLDFKTDDVKRAAVAERANLYKPQLAAYSAALKKTYGRDVTRRWLHFLSCGETIPV